MDRTTTTPDALPIPGKKQIVYTQTRVLHTDPRYLKRHRIISGPNDPIEGPFKVLRTQVRQRMRANEWQTLAITSAHEGAGKTLTSVNLAITLARDVNQTVLLVDLDLRRPSVASYFTKEKLPGLSEYLLNDVPLSELLFNPEGVDGLVVLPGDRPIVHSSETLSSPRMVALVEEVKQRYPSRIVLLDMPPVLGCDDVLAFSPYFDAALLVVEENRTTREEISQSLELLKGTRLLGTVLNKSHEEVPNYGYPVAS